MVEASPEIKLKINVIDKKVPKNMLEHIVLNIVTLIALFNPNLIIVNKLTKFASPNLTPGIGCGK